LLYEESLKRGMFIAPEFTTETVVYQHSPQYACSAPSYTGMRSEQDGQALFDAYRDALAQRQLVGAGTLGYDRLTGVMAAALASMQSGHGTGHNDVVVGVLGDREVAPRRLFLERCQHSSNVGNSITGGEWCLYGGKVEQGETLLGALAREILNRLGVQLAIAPNSAAPPRLVHAVRVNGWAIHTFVISDYVGVVEPADAVLTDWVSEADLRSLLLDGAVLGGIRPTASTMDALHAVLEAVYPQRAREEADAEAVVWDESAVACEEALAEDREQLLQLERQLSQNAEGDGAPVEVHMIDAWRMVREILHRQPSLSTYLVIPQELLDDPKEDPPLGLWD
jgi:8-oxo-dGTP pyrophosphatase MutT (NUDIX family)